MNQASIFTAIYNEDARRKKKTGSGSGTSKIELPQTKGGVKITAKRPRSGIRRSVSTKGGKINAVIISHWVHNDAKASNRLNGALRYNQKRELGRDEKERTFFTEKENDLDRADIRSEIKDRFGKDIAFHTMILSPGDNNVNVKDFVRETMDDWQKELGYDLDYYSIEHRNTEHYHAHLIIPASSTDRFSDARFNREDLNDLRELANDYIARERMLNRAWDKAVEREFYFDKQKEYDRELQEYFHMSPADYQRDQESVDLSTYKDYVKEQQELGLSSKGWEADKQLIDDLYMEPWKFEHPLEDEANWDKHADDIYEESSIDVGTQLDEDANIMRDMTYETMMSDEEDHRRDNDDDLSGGH